MFFWDNYMDRPIYCVDKITNGQLMRRNRRFCSVPLIGACWPRPLCLLVLLVFLHTNKIHELASRCEYNSHQCNICWCKLFPIRRINDGASNIAVQQIVL
jgi:hypothetical protein